jgi:hypothetical protein
LKSVGYSSLDIIEELMPATFDVAKNTVNVGQDLAVKMTNVKNSDRTLKNALDKNYYIGLGKEFWRNSLDDLKSGKFYNKERKEAWMAKQGGDDDFDMGDFGFGDEDFDSFGDEDYGDFDDFEDSIVSDDGNTEASFARKKGKNVDVTQISVSSDLGPDSTIVRATEFQTETNINIGRAVVENSRTENRILTQFLGEMRNELNSSLVSMADNVSQISTSVVDTLGKHTSLSAKYYEDSIAIQQQILEHLKTNVTGAATTELNTKKLKDYNNVMDLFSSGGFIDLKGYGDIVKKQFKNYASSNMVLSALQFAADNKETLNMMAQNPLSFLTNGLARAILPKATKAAISAFDNQLKETGVAVLDQISGLRRSENPIFRAIGEIFGLTNKITLKNIDKGAYNKGAMSWSGLDHQALTNVIPTYLRKIYATLSGTQEFVFDYENGVYKSLADVEREQRDSTLRRKTGAYSEDISNFGEYLKDNFALSPIEQKAASDAFKKFAAGVAMDYEGGRTYKLGGRTGKDENRDDIRDLIGASTSDDLNVKLIRAYFEQLSKTDRAMLTSFFGSKRQEQRATYDREMRDMQANPTKYNTQYMNTGLAKDVATNVHLEYKDKNDPRKVTGIKSGVMAGFTDKYGHNQNYYLRAILKTLSTGIFVIPVTPDTILQTVGKNGETTEDKFIYDRIAKVSQKNRDKLKKDTTADEKRTRERELKDNYSDEKREKDKQRGKVDPRELDQEQLTTVATATALAEKQKNNLETGGFLAKVVDFFGEDSGLGQLVNNFKGKTGKVGATIAKPFEVADRFLFSLVFGGDGDKSVRNLINKGFDYLKIGFKKFTGFMDEKLLKPLNEALFGEDGLVTKIKESEFGKGISEFFGNLIDKTESFILGDKGPDGTRVNGIFSEAANSLKDIGQNVKDGIFGEKGPDGKRLPLDQDNSVLGNIRRMVHNVTGNIESSLGLDEARKEEPLSTRIVNTTDRMFDRIKERGKDWSDTVFGKEGEDRKRQSIFDSEFAKQFKSDLSGQKGYIAATSGIGLLSSFFLPGGPIGGALVGAGYGIIKKSTGLQEFLFGPDINGERQGGLITKETQDFFNKHKNAMGFGATAGLLSSFGLLPSFFLPGGPIGGALIATGASLIAKSGAFDDLLYGPGGTPENPVGGLSKKLREVFGKDATTKTVALDVGIGAGLGVLGSLFLPTGPIIGALVGSAISVATATDKFRDWFFGEEGPDGTRTGGLVSKFKDKLGNFFMGEVGPDGKRKGGILDRFVTSIKLAQTHIGEFIETQMVLPFKSAIEPFTAEVKKTTTKIKDRVTSAIDDLKGRFAAKVIDPVAEAFRTHLIDPMKNAFRKLFSGLGKVVGAIISAPFKVVEGMGNATYEKHRRQGKQAYVDAIDSQLNPFNRANWTNQEGGFWNGVRGFGGAVLNWGRARTDRTALDAAQYSDAGAYYDRNNTIKKRERDRLAKEAAHNKWEQRRNEIRGRYAPPKGTSTTTTKPPKGSTSMGTSVPTDTKIATPSDKDRRKELKNRYKEMESKGYTGEKLRRKTLGRKGAKDSSASSGLNFADWSRRYIPLDRTKTPGSTSIDTSVPKGSTTSTSTAKPPKGSTTSATETSPDTKPKKTKDTSTLLTSIQKDVSKISDSVYGQLNGVGSNVNKTYKLLLKKFGVKDEDIKGNNNKQYVGFFGRIRTALNNPLKAAKNAILSPIFAIGDAIKSGATKVKNFGLNIVMNLKGIGKAIGGIAKGFGSLLLEVAKLPFQVVSTGLKLIKELAPAVGEALKTTVSVIGDGIKVAGSLLVTGVKSIGNVFTEAASGLGAMIGGAMHGLGSLFQVLGIVGKDALVGIWKGMKFIGGGIAKGVKFAASVPFKAVSWVKDKLSNRKGKGGGGLFGNGPIHVIVDSGTLDKVKRVKIVEKVYETNTGGPIAPPDGPKFKTFSEFINGFENGLLGELEKDKNGDTAPGIPHLAEGSVIPPNKKFLAVLGDQKEGVNVETPLQTIKDALTEVLTGEKTKARGTSDRAEQAERGSRASLLERLNQKEREEKESLFRTQLLNFTKRSAESSEEHKSSFFKVFDIKKGIITAGLLFLAPYIMKLFTKFDIGGFLSSMVSNLDTGFKEIGGITGLLNNIKENVQNASDVISGRSTRYKLNNGELVYDTNGNLVTEDANSTSIKELFTPTETRINTDTGEFEYTNNWTSASDTKLNFVAGRARNISKTVDRTKKVIKRDVRKFKRSTLGKKVTEKVAKSADTGMIATAVNFMKKGITLLKDKFIALGKKFGVKITESSLGSVMSKFLKHLDVEKLAKNSKIAQKIAKFSAKATAKGVSAAATLMLSEVGFAAFGALSGATNAGALFEVSPDAVDAKMRAIAAVFRGLLNTSLGSWIDLFNSIIYEIMGTSFIKVIASHVYKLLSSDEKGQALEDAQNKFTEDYEAYVDDEYNTYAEKQKAEGKEAMSKEEFISSGLATTREEYNSKTNKSLTKRAADLVKGVVGSPKKFATGIKSSATALATNAKELGSIALSGDIKGFATYVAKNEDGEISVGQNMVLGLGKQLLTPVVLLKSAFNGIRDLFTKEGGVIDIAKDTSVFIGNLYSYTNPDKDMTGWEKETIGGEEGGFFTSIVSSLIKKVFWLPINIIRLVRSAFGWFIDFFDGDSENSTGENGTKTSTKKKEGGFFSKVASGVKGFFTKLFGGDGGEDGGRPIYGKGGTEDYYYSQNDPKYKNKLYKQTGGFGYGAETMGESGCGPTAMAMVASKMTSNTYDPMQMAKLSEAGGYSTSLGTSPEYFGAAADTLGIPNKFNAPSYESVSNSLASGNSIILQGIKGRGTNSPFTSQGHYVVVDGIENGNLIISDPRGKEYSGQYKASDVMADATGMWSFGGGMGQGKKSVTGKLKKFLKGGKGGDTEKWLSIVKAVKQAIAAQKPGYSNPSSPFYIDITIGGKTIKVRPDCSGFVSACLKYFGVLDEGINLNSRDITDRNNSTMKKTGFTPMAWPGWEALQPGDIMALNGHTEIFAFNDGNRHRVYNCGSDSSVNNPGDTGTAKTNGYTTVWRCGAAGSLAVGDTGVSSSSSSGDSTTASASGEISNLSDFFGQAANIFTGSIMESLGFKTSGTSSDTTTENSSSVADVELTGSDNAEKVWNFFTSRGYSKAATAGILGNMWQESRVDPTLIQKPSQNAAGILQWENYKNQTDRWLSMKNYAASKGKDWKDLQSQLEFADSEINASGMDFWFKKNANTTVAEWKNSTDPLLATEQFEKAYERAGKPLMEKRKGAAQKYYQLYAGKGGDGGRPIVPMYESRDIKPSYFGGKGSVSASSNTLQSPSADQSKTVDQTVRMNFLNSEESSQLLNTMIQYLSKIADNTGEASNGIKDLYGKDFNVVTNNINATSNNQVNANGKTNTDKTNNGQPADRSKYNMAKRVAAGFLS